MACANCIGGRTRKACIQKRNKKKPANKPAIASTTKLKILPNINSILTKKLLLNYYNLETSTQAMARPHFGFVKEVSAVAQVDFSCPIFTKTKRS